MLFYCMLKCQVIVTSYGNWWGYLYYWLVSRYVVVGTSVLVISCCVLVSLSSSCGCCNILPKKSYYDADRSASANISSPKRFRFGGCPLHKIESQPNAIKHANYVSMTSLYLAVPKTVIFFILWNDPVKEWYLGVRCLVKCRYNLGCWAYAMYGEVRMIIDY